MMIIDARHLFIDNHVVESAASNSGWHVFDLAVVAWARAVFSLIWDGATRWQDTEPMDGALTGRQAAILRELAAGYDQEQVATRVGVRTRTVSAELAAAKEALEMRSTAQLMAWWGMVTRSGDRPPR
jgi:DNA-binding NarL/FixJ family response regulator